MKKLGLCLLASLMLLVGCDATSGNSDKKYNITGPIQTIDIMNVDVDMSGYKGFTDVNHAFKRTTLKEVFRLIDEKGSGFVYLGYTGCAWCTASVPVINDVAKKYGQTVYYVDVHHNQDKLSEEDVNRYYEDFSDFIGKDDDGKPAFFVPQILLIVNGEVLDGHLGTVESHDPSVQLEMNKKEIKEYTKIIEPMFKALSGK